MIREHTVAGTLIQQPQSHPGQVVERTNTKRRDIEEDCKGLRFLSKEF